jgi:hypothetical protein
MQLKGACPRNVGQILALFTKELPREIVVLLCGAGSYSTDFELQNHH